MLWTAQRHFADTSLGIKVRYVRPTTTPSRSTSRSSVGLRSGHVARCVQRVISPTPQRRAHLRQRADRILGAPMLVDQHAGDRHHQLAARLAGTAAQSALQVADARRYGGERPKPEVALIDIGLAAAGAADLQRHPFRNQISNRYAHHGHEHIGNTLGDPEAALRTNLPFGAGGASTPASRILSQNRHSFLDKRPPFAKAQITTLLAGK